MFGENLKPIAMQCIVCRVFVAMQIDPEDVRRHADGLFVQDAFADRAGVPYLNAGERELFVSGVCDGCWPLLCPDPLVSPLDYN
jgi:hypothetical protein